MQFQTRPSTASLEHKARPMLSGHKRKRGHDDSQLSQANGKHGAGSVTPESDERRHNPAKAARTHTTAGISDRRNESGQGAPTPATNGKPSTVPTRGESDSGTASAQEAAGQKQISPGVWQDPRTGLEYRVVSNDGSDQHLMWLIDAKNIFSQQLPKMPKEYIVRLVLDRKHRCLLALKAGHVVGGVCFRPFEQQHFAEIVFLAVTSSEQIKGYGTLLMNQLKETVKPMGISHFLTYADNYAIGYFKKQGFTKTVTMPRQRWVGYIKDYDGGTLMECVIYFGMNYLTVRADVERFRQDLVALLRTQSHANRVYPGLLPGTNPRDIPGLQEAGWDVKVVVTRRSARDAVNSGLQSALRALHTAICQNADAWPFEKPVDTKVLTDYLDIVKTPVDLSLIRQRLEAGCYKTLEMFSNELMLMLSNCRAYNKPGTNYHKAADRLETFVTRRVRQLADQLKSVGPSS